MLYSINQLFSEFLVWLLVMVRESIFVKAPSNKLWDFKDYGKEWLSKNIFLSSFPISLLGRRYYFARRLSIIENVTDLLPSASTIKLSILKRAEKILSKVCSHMNYEIGILKVLKCNGINFTLLLVVVVVVN